MLQAAKTSIKDPVDNEWITRFVVSAHLSKTSSNSIELVVDYSLKTGHPEGTINIGSTTSSIFTSSNWDKASQPISPSTTKNTLNLTVPFEQLTDVFGVKVSFDENTDNESTSIRKIYFSFSTINSPKNGSTFFPEQELNAYKNRLDLGVCYSGGGTRSLLLSMGQMRFLNQAPYYSKIGYATSVSGGSWANTINSFSTEKEVGNLVGEIIPSSESSKYLTETNVPLMAEGAKKYEFGINLLINLIKAISPELLKLDAVKKNAEKSKLIDILTGALANVKSIPADRVWIDAVGSCYFQPNGLYNAQEIEQMPFTLDQSSIKDLLENNGSIVDLFGHQGDNFRTTSMRDGTNLPPYYIANSLMLRPTDSTSLVNSTYVGNEYTPLYTGAVYNGKWQKTFTYGPLIGGGNIASYNYGMQSVGLKDANTVITMHQSNQPLTSLAVASGTSSSAFAGTTSYVSGLFTWAEIVKHYISFFGGSDSESTEAQVAPSSINVKSFTGGLSSLESELEEVLKTIESKAESFVSLLEDIFDYLTDAGKLIDGITPKSNYYSPVDTNNPTENTLFNYGDGGLSDNFGIISLLRRKVKKVIVFVNSEVAFDAATSTIDSSVSALFGAVKEQPPKYSGEHLDDMTVFEKEQFQVLLDKFKACGSDTLVAETTLKVLPNNDWGLEGNYDVEVLWYYNSLPSSFETKVGTEVMEKIKSENTKSLGEFPLFSTIPSTIFGLSPFQINMMGEVGYYNLENTKQQLDAFIGI